MVPPWCCRPTRPSGPSGAGAGWPARWARWWVAPLTALQTPEQVLAEHAARDDDQPPPEPPLPPEEMAALLHEVEDRHYREILSQPIPMLGGKSPRQATRSKAGRQKVAEWLKLLEGQKAQPCGIVR